MLRRGLKLPSPGVVMGAVSVVLLNHDVNVSFKFDPFAMGKNFWILLRRVEWSKVHDTRLA